MRPIKKQSQQRAVSLASTARKGGGNVRIIAGRWRRSVLPVADAAGLRPTGDRVRETRVAHFDQLRHQAFHARSIEVRLDSEKKAAREAKAKAHAPHGRHRRR